MRSYLQNGELLARAVAAGLPPFIEPISQSNALNATPYLATWADFVHFFGVGAREPFILELETSLKYVAEAGAQAVAILIGGSFVRLHVKVPQDLDGVCFYRGGNGETAAALINFAARGKMRRIDLRYIPLDANPVIALKACAFFATLYARDRYSSALQHGCVLVAL